MLYVYMPMCVLLAILAAESFFDIKFLKRIVTSVFIALTASYAISPIIPYGTNIKDILTPSFAEVFGAAAVGYMTAAALVLFFVMLLSIFIDKAVTLASDIYTAIFSAVSIFAFLSALASIDNFTAFLNAFFESKDMSMLKTITDCVVIDKTLLAFILITAVAVAIISVIIFIKNKKLYGYVSLVVFAVLTGVMFAFANVFESIFSAKSEFGGMLSQLSDISAVKDTILSVVGNLSAALSKGFVFIAVLPIVSVFLRVLSERLLKKRPHDDADMSK